MSSADGAARLAVGITDLEIGAMIGEGGEARVHEARYLGDEPELRSSGPIVAKLLAEPTARSVVAGVNLLATVLNTLGNEDPTVASKFNVPIRVLVNGDALIGYLIPRIDPQFMRTGQRYPQQSGEPRLAERLFLSRSSAESVGLWFATLAERLALCRQLATAFEFLHRKELVYGDLSGRNVLYSLRPSADVVLLDCESLRVVGSANSNPQMTTPGWTQAGRSAQSRYTDQAKLSVFMLRALSPGAGAAMASDPSRIRGAEVVGGERGRVPEIFLRAHGSVTAAEWVTWMSDALDRTDLIDGWTRGRKGDWLRIR